MKFKEFYKTIYKKLKEKGYRITMTGVKNGLLEHPFYPSLQSVTDYLADMDIPSTVVRLEFYQLKEALNEADVIVLVKDEEGDNLLWVKEIKEGEILFVNEKTIPQEEFEKIWKGVTLLLQADEIKEEENYKFNIQKENRSKWFFTIITGAFLCLFLANLISNHFSPFSIYSQIPKYGGLLFSILLAAMELGFKMPITEKLCSISTNKGCEKAAQSRLSSITRNIKLADVGLIYFITVLLFQYMDGSPLLAYIGLLCLPVIFISVLYQTFILKVFCPLCMGVMTMLLLDILVYWCGGLYQTWTNISLEDLILLGGIGGLITGCWFGVKQLIEEKNGFENFKYEYNRLFRQPERIKTLLDSLPEDNTDFIPYDIQLGDPNPKIIITEIMSPFCGPCGGSMDKATELLNMFDEGLQIRIRLTDSKGEKEKNMEVISHLLTLSQELDNESLIKAFSDWFDKMDYPTWSQYHPKKGQRLSEEEVTVYLDTIRKYKIEYTPTVYIGNKRVPSGLSVGDLRYYIEEDIPLE